MVPGMLNDTVGRCQDRFQRDYFRASSPALVSVLIDIAMITGQVAAAVHLKNELPERQDFGTSQGQLNAGIKRREGRSRIVGTTRGLRVFDVID